MAKKKWLPYIRVRFYRDRLKALAESKRLRETGRYRAKVLRTTIKKHYDWTLWTSRLER